MDTTTLDVERIQSLDALEAIREIWNTLLEKNGTKTVELTYEWQMTYWKHFNENAELFVLVMKEKSVVKAIVPLKLTLAKMLGLKVRRLEFVAAAESNYQDVIIGENSVKILEYLFNYLLIHQESWDVLSLKHIPVTSATADFCFQKLSPRLLYSAVSEECIYLTIDKDWDVYAANSQKARNRVADQMRKLQRQRGGKIHFFLCLDRAELERNLLEFFRLHRKRWNKTATPSQFNDERYCEFYLDVAPELLTREHVSLFVLTFEDIPIAMVFAFRFGKTYLYQLSAYDTEYSKYSPSHIVHELSVKQAFLEEMDEVDFGHYYPHKELWANKLKQRINFNIYPRRLLPKAFYTYTVINIAILAGLRRISVLYSIAKYLRERIRSFDTIINRRL